MGPHHTDPVMWWVGYRQKTADVVVKRRLVPAWLKWMGMRRVRQVTLPKSRVGLLRVLIDGRHIG
jgi:hypothetical protein